MRYFDRHKVMTDEQAKLCPFNAFDMTKIFSHKLYPLRRVGKLILNENPTNYVSQIEQAAFTPANLPPGIDVSPDQILRVCTLDILHSTSYQRALF